MKIQWFNMGRTLAPDDDFFLPELCEPEALLGLVLLAELLRIEPEVLRFGDPAQRSLPPQHECQEPGVGYLERETFDAFLRLPAPQRQLVREVILTFAKVHGEG